MPTERCRENKRPIHTWPHPMSWPCHCPCPCPVQVTVAVTELIIRMVWCMSRHAQQRLNFILSLTIHVCHLLLQLFMVLLVSMWCMYRQRAVICLETFKLGCCCCLGIFASIHHQSKGSMQSNVCIAVISC